MWTLKFDNAVPHGGWRYTVPETGVTLRASSLDGLELAVLEHCVANRIPVKPHRKQTITNAVCEQSPGFCNHQDPTIRSMAKSFAHAMLDWARSGFKVVDKEQFEARLKLCDDCDYWRGWSAGFGYGRCRKCGCSGLKLFLPTQVCPAGKW